MQNWAKWLLYTMFWAEAQFAFRLGPQAKAWGLLSGFTGIYRPESIKLITLIGIDFKP